MILTANIPENCIEMNIIVSMMNGFNVRLRGTSFILSIIDGGG